MASTFNAAKFDFVTLRLFCAVAQSGSITQGAQACHLALSAASRRLSEFEAATGSQLMERSKKGVALTPAGHLALQHALRLFQGFELFNSELSDYSRGIRGHVRLWANMSSLTEFLPGILSEFMAAHPDVAVEVEEQLSGDTVRALMDGIADLGVFAQGTPHDGLVAHPFQMDELVVLCPLAHPLAARQRVSFVTCLEHEFVGLNRGSSLLELTARAAEKAGKPMHLRVQVRSFDAMCHMIAAGLGIGIAPRAACVSQIKTLGLTAITLRDAWAKRQLLVAHSARRELPAAAQLLLTRLLHKNKTTASKP